jgi:hypothetical protein
MINTYRGLSIGLPNVPNHFDGHEIGWVDILFVYIFTLAIEPLSNGFSILVQRVM